MFAVRHKEKENNRVLQIPVEKICPNPKQPRSKFDEKALLSLAQSVEQNGILQPLTVRALSDGAYELVAGERRFRAAMMAGLDHVPCITVEVSDEQSALLALLENLQRQDLNFFEEADGIARLIEVCGLTQEEIAKKLGKSQSAIANKLRLLHLSNAERQKILDAGLTERHARALLRLVDEERQTALKMIISKNLNVQETDKLVESMIFAKSEHKRVHTMPVIKDMRIFINTINNAVNVMKQAGIAAITTQSEHEDYFEYTVRIPKSRSNTA